jgi:phosphatidylinositol glycan class V
MVLRRLTKHHSGSAQFALLTCAVSLIATSPATWLIGSYSEPFYAFFALRGLIFLHGRAYFLASAAFAFATLFRANGILLSGFLVWGLVVAPLLRGHNVSHHGIPFKSRLLCAYRSLLCIRVKLRSFSILYTFILVGICASPLVLHQLHGYRLFCVSATQDAPREWCERTIPTIYSFVQSYYWDVGLLKYWRLDQVPNFLMASPPLVFLVCSAVAIIRVAVLPVVRRVTSVSGKMAMYMGDGTTSLDAEMFPHAVHALVIALILIFASHTQIALRVIPTLPFMHWSVARLFIHKAGPAKAGWMCWCVIWWAVSCVLWGAFLPPA